LLLRVIEIPLPTRLTLTTRLGTIPELIMVFGAWRGLSAAFVGRAS
jgi:hypothetical protein